MRRAKPILRYLLAALMIGMGVMHFAAPENFVRIVPGVLPFKELIVYVSGVFEVALGAALLVERTRVYAAWGLVALFICVFPANVNMAVNGISFGVVSHPALLSLRLPLQGVLIAWAWWFTRADVATPRRA